MPPASDVGSGSCGIHRPARSSPHHHHHAAWSVSLLIVMQPRRVHPLARTRAARFARMPPPTFRAGCASTGPLRCLPLGFPRGPPAVPGCPRAAEPSCAWRELSQLKYEGLRHAWLAGRASTLTVTLNFRVGNGVRILSSFNRPVPPPKRARPCNVHSPARSHSFRPPECIKVSTTAPKCRTAPSREPRAHRRFDAFYPVCVPISILAIAICPLRLPPEL